MAINRLTRRGPLRKVEPEVLENAAAAGASPLETLVQAEQAAELYRGLERLKPVDRATLMAFYIRGRSLQQMSREFDDARRHRQAASARRAQPSEEGAGARRRRHVAPS